METVKAIPPAVEALIPIIQKRMTKENLKAYAVGIERLTEALEKCPNIGETDGMSEHPAIFHFFFMSSDFFICEYDKKDKMFGYAIIGGDLNNCEWGYLSLQTLTSNPYLNIDYHFEEQSIEAALYKAYPQWFNKPNSLRA